MKQMCGIQFNIRRISLLVFLFVSILVKGQVPLLSFYKYNENYLNPAFAGVRHVFETTFVVHKQYFNKNISPSMVYLDANGLISDKYKIAGGLTYTQERIGVFYEHNFAASFAYRILLKETYGKVDYISFGLRPQFELQHVSAGQLYALDSGDPLNVDFNSGKSVRFSSGVAYVSTNYYVGASVLNFGGVVFSQDVYTHKPQKTPFYTLSAGYYYPLNQDFDLHLFGHSTYNTSLNYGAQGVLVFKEKLFGGINGRTGDHLGAIVGVNVPLTSGPVQLSSTSVLKLLYGVEMKRLANSSPVMYHEIVLSYVLVKAKRKYKCDCKWIY